MLWEEYHYRQPDPEARGCELSQYGQLAREAMKRAANLNISSSDIKNIVVLSSPSSALSGHLLKVIADRMFLVPVIVSEELYIPGFVGRSSIAFVLSAGGADPDALELIQASANRGAQLLYMGTSGEASDWAEQQGIPNLVFPGSFSEFVLDGYLVLPILRALQGSSFLTQDLSFALEEAVQTMDELVQHIGPAVTSLELNPAKQLAKDLFGKICLILGSSLNGPVAMEWSRSIARESGQLSEWDVLPDLPTGGNHLLQSASPTELHVTLLRDPSEHPGLKSDFEALASRLREGGIIVEEVLASGQSILSRLASMMYVGKFATLYLRMLSKRGPIKPEFSRS